MASRVLRLAVRVADVSRDDVQVAVEDESATIADLTAAIVRWANLEDSGTRWALVEPDLGKFPKNALVRDAQLRDGQEVELRALEASGQRKAPILGHAERLRLVQESGIQAGLAWPVPADELKLTLEAGDGRARRMILHQGDTGRVVLTVREVIGPDGAVVACHLNLTAPDGTLLVVGGQPVDQAEGHTAPIGALVSIRVGDTSGADTAVAADIPLRILDRAEHDALRPRGGSVDYRARPVRFETLSAPLAESLTPPGDPPDHEPWWLSLSSEALMVLMYVLLAFRDFSVYSLLFPAAAIGVGVLRWRERKRRTDLEDKKWADKDAAFTREFGVLEFRVLEEARIIDARNPTIGALARDALERGPLLWSRRLDSPEFLHISVGTGMYRSPSNLSISGYQTDLSLTGSRKDIAALRQLKDAQIELSLNETHLAIVGPDEETAAVAREIIVRLASLHSPAHVLLAVMLPNDTTQLERWDWIKWMPHVHTPAEVFAGPRVVAGADQCRKAIEESLPLVADPERDARHIVLVVDENSGVRSGDVERFVAASKGRGHVIWVGGLLSRVPPIVDRQIQVVQPHPEGGFSAMLYSGMPEFASRSTKDDEPEAVGPALPSLIEESFSDPTELRMMGLDRAQAAGICSWLAPLVDESSVRISEGMPQRVLLSDIASAPSMAGDGLKAHRALKAALGLDDRAVFGIDLVDDGPHMLVAGTTGSGKSEMLRTLVLSLASRYAPTEVAFLLVDFKGGASLRQLDTLPHAIGMVSNLDSSEVSRIVKFLGAEILRRQRLLGLPPYNGEYKKFRQDGGRLPRLVVVIDEFAGFMQDNSRERANAILDIAARGRSLGIHLVLATQSPKGVVDAGVRANVHARICLRTLDESEAHAVVEADEPSRIPKALHGRAYARLESGQWRAFQCAITGNSTAGSRGMGDVAFAADYRLSGVSLVGAGTSDSDSDDGQAIGGPTVEHQSNTDDSDDSDQSEATDLISAIRERVLAQNSPWQRPTAEEQPRLEASLTSADKLSSEGRLAAVNSGVFTVGMVDRPEKQLQELMRLDLAEGGALLAGPPRSGRTSALLSFAWAGAAAGMSVVYVSGGGADFSEVALPSGARCFSGRERADLDILLDQLTATYPSDGTISPATLVLLDRIELCDSAFLGDPRLPQVIASAGGQGIFVVASQDENLSLEPQLRRSFRRRYVLLPFEEGVLVGEDQVVGRIFTLEVAKGLSAPPKSGGRELVPAVRSVGAGRPRPLGRMSSSDARGLAVTNVSRQSVPVGVNATRHEQLLADLREGVVIVDGHRGQSGKTTTLLSIAFTLHAATGRPALWLDASTVTLPPAPYVLDLREHLRSFAEAAVGATGRWPVERNYDDAFSALRASCLPIVLLDDEERFSFEDSLYSVFGEQFNQSAQGSLAGALQSFVSSSEVFTVCTRSVDAYFKGASHAFTGYKYGVEQPTNVIMLRPPPRSALPVEARSNVGTAKLDLISNRRLIEYGPGEGVALVGSRRSEYLAVVPPEVADCVQEMRERRSVVEATAF